MMKTTIAMVTAVIMTRAHVITIVIVNGTAIGSHHDDHNLTRSSKTQQEGRRKRERCKTRQARMPTLKAPTETQMQNQCELHEHDESAGVKKALAQRLEVVFCSTS